MALPVYSVTFICVQQATTGAVTTYTVPTGKTAVIRSIDVVQFAAVASHTYVNVNLTGSSTVYIFDPKFPAASATVPSYVHWDGHVAVPAAGIIQASVTGVGASSFVTVSGFLLTN